jgi:hypothetical protein
MYGWLLLIFLIEVLIWLVWIEVPRLNRLLAQIRRQQHAHTLRLPSSGNGADSSASMEGEDADSAALHAHAETLQFRVDPLTLTVSYTDADDGTQRQDTGVAEVLSIRDEDHTASRGGRPLFLMVPGNPGLVNFYKLFVLYMHRLTKGAVEVSNEARNEAHRGGVALA